MIETPDYLSDLIGDFRSAKHKDRWIAAATKVENYRHRHGITDLGSAFGVQPAGVEGSLWRRAHNEVFVTLEPPAARRGIRIR